MENSIIFIVYIALNGPTRGHTSIGFISCRPFDLLGSPHVLMQTCDKWWDVPYLSPCLACLRLLVSACWVWQQIEIPHATGLHTSKIPRKLKIKRAARVSCNQSKLYPSTCASAEDREIMLWCYAKGIFVKDEFEIYFEREKKEQKLFFCYSHTQKMTLCIERLGCHKGCIFNLS